MYRELTISIVIPCYNVASTIGTLLSGLHNQTIDSSIYEIIVIDDGSTDETIEETSRFTDVIVLKQNQSGPGAARNLGMNQAKGELILFLDADLRVSESLLEKHIEFHKNNDQVFATGGSVEPYENYPLFSWALVDHFSSWFNAHPAVVYTSDIEYLPSLNFCIKNDKKLLKRELAWDNGLTHTGEDVIYCYKIKQLGLKLAFLSDAVVYHQDRMTIGGYWKHLYRWGYHAPFVRGTLPELSYSFLFPKRPVLLFFTAPLIFSGYTFLVWKAWFKAKPLQITLALPQLMIGRLAYVFGVIKGTRKKFSALNS